MASQRLESNSEPETIHFRSNEWNVDAVGRVVHFTPVADWARHRLSMGCKCSPVRVCNQELGLTEVQHQSFDGRELFNDGKNYGH